MEQDIITLTVSGLSGGGIVAAAIKYLPKLLKNGDIREKTAVLGSRVDKLDETCKDLGRKIDTTNERITENSTELAGLAGEVREALKHVRR